MSARLGVRVLEQAPPADEAHLCARGLLVERGSAGANFEQ